MTASPWSLVRRALATLPGALVGALLGCGAPAGSTKAPLAADERALTPLQLLGKRLFEDTSLSEPPGQACASCHRADQAFTGNAGSHLDAVAAGSRPGVFGVRNVPSVMYASFSPRFTFLPGLDEHGQPDFTPVGGEFRDGRAADLVEQAKGPFLNPREMNNAGPATVVAKVRAGATAELFRQVYGEEGLDDPDAAYQRIALAITAYESTPRFHPFSSRFDEVLRGEAQLDARETLGFAVFQDPARGNCLACHAGVVGSRASADWLFTDFTYDTLGIPRNPAIPDNADPTSFDLGLCQQPGLAERAPAGYQLERACGAFKVPSLRNVAVTAPYMHNGFFPDLENVVRFYATRDTSPLSWYPPDDAGVPRRFDDVPPEYRANVNTSEVPYDRQPGQAPRLTDEEVEAVVAFLRTLTDR